MEKYRFNRNVLEQLTEDELSLLYVMYSKLFNKNIDLRSVFVAPVLKSIKQYDGLTTEGEELRDNIVNKIQNYYGLEKVY